jgi:hypothetical protein
VSERLTLYGVNRLAEPARAWARATRESRPEADTAELAAELRTHSAQIARVDGAISGTPFFIALVPGYLNYLWQETRMTLRLAALYGRDPRELRTSAELLTLRGVHPTVEAAEAALVEVRERGAPPKPDRRRSLRVWYLSVRRVLVFGGFLAPPKARGGIRFVRLRTIFGVLVGLGIWVVTWVFPVTFMIAMAWGCEAHTRQLFRRTVMHYSDDPETSGPHHARLELARDPDYSPRHLIGAGAVTLSIAAPIAFLAYAIHVRNTVGLNWVSGLAALVAVSVVIAMVVLGSRRW